MCRSLKSSSRFPPSSLVRRYTTRGFLILVARLTTREQAGFFLLCHNFAIGGSIPSRLPFGIWHEPRVFQSKPSTPKSVYPAFPKGGSLCCVNVTRFSGGVLSELIPV